jgi:glycosyltransferase involved in cell wall biosynthesis
VTRTRRVVVNTAIYLHGTSGSATATRALADAVGQLPDVEMLEAAPRRRGGPVSALNAIRDARWDLWGASHAFPDVDLLVSPCNIGRGGPARKHLLVVYDVMVYDHPELFDRKFAAYFRMLVPGSLRSADRVLTMSEHARGRLLRIAPRADIRVVTWSHPGRSGVRAVWPARPVVLMVGATEPVKNHGAGISAVAELRRTTGVDVGLRLLGREGRDESTLRRMLGAVDPAGSWTSREVDVPDAVRDAAYASSWLLLQPSLDEGQGLPLVEAARHGLPVVHSGRGAMPTVMPLVNAGSVLAEGLTEAMRPLLDEVRWKGLSQGALDRSRAFDPDRFVAAVHEHASDLLPASS